MPYTYTKATKNDRNTPLRRNLSYAQFAFIAASILMSRVRESLKNSPGTFSGTFMPACSTWRDMDHFFSSAAPLPAFSPDGEERVGSVRGSRTRRLLRLPIEPEWKRDYAASVRRLIRDGVDTPLASLFVHVARARSPDAEGEDRARSATEAFLYRRLGTLPETAGRFRLNTDLPIPFDGRGRMEVDLFCAEAGVAIELDGAQHLADAEAYRRDRRKDALLQQHGYFVLRFLAEDVGKCLDAVLDTILATLARRQGNRG